MDPTLTQPVTLDAPGSAEGVKPQPVTMPTVPGEVTTTSLVPSGPNVPSVFPVLAVTPNPDAAPPVPPGITLGKPDLEVLVADRSMADLAQSLAVNEARGNPHARSFSGVMTGLRQACGLMTEGFQEVCLGVEVVVQKTLQEATAHDQAFTAKAAKDLDLWTSALQPLFDTDNV